MFNVHKYKNGILDVFLLIQLNSHTENPILQNKMETMVSSKVAIRLQSSFMLAKNCEKTGKDLITKATDETWIVEKCKYSKWTGRKRATKKVNSEQQLLHVKCEIGLMKNTMKNLDPSNLLVWYLVFIWIAVHSTFSCMKECRMLMDQNWLRHCAFAVNTNWVQ